MINLISYRVIRVQISGRQIIHVYRQLATHANNSRRYLTETDLITDEAHSYPATYGNYLFGWPVIKN